MAENKVLRWRDGRGWLVLSGGVMLESEVRARVLERALVEGGVAYIAVNAPAGSDALSDMEDLGAPTGYWVDVQTEDDVALRKQLSEAGIIVIEDTTTPETLRSSLVGAALEGLLDAYERGAVVLLEGRSASVFCAWYVLDGAVFEGLNWLENALFMPAVTSITESAPARGFLEGQPQAVAVGAGVGSALVLGPAGEVEIWGERQVTIALGRAYQ